MHICAQQIAEPVPSLLQFAPEIPPRLAALVERTLTKAPEGRPTMREFRQALLQIRDDLNQADGLADHPTRALGKALDPTVPMRRDQAPTAIPLPVVRKATGQPSTRWKPIAAGVIALVWLAILAVWALS